METLQAFHALKQAGKILDYGVSNFDLDDLEEAFALPGGNQTATDQVLYNPLHRGIEWNLLPWCRAHGVPVMAYSPIEHSLGEQRSILDDPQVKLIAARHGAAPAQVALAWLLAQDVVVIPKARNLAHVRENRASLDLKLTREDLSELDHAFPPPRKKISLEMK